MKGWPPVFSIPAKVYAEAILYSPSLEKLPHQHILLIPKELYRGGFDLIHNRARQIKGDLVPRPLPSMKDICNSQTSILWTERSSNLLSNGRPFHPPTLPKTKGRFTTHTLIYPFFKNWETNLDCLPSR